MGLGWVGIRGRGRGMGRDLGCWLDERRLPSRHTLKMAVKKILTWYVTCGW